MPFDAQIERTVQALEDNGMHAIVVENGAEARKKIAELLPAGAEAFISSSTTLNVLGITEDVDKSGRYDSVRAMQAYGKPSVIAKLLIVNRETTPGRITVVIVKEDIGF